MTDQTQTPFVAVEVHERTYRYIKCPACGEDYLSIGHADLKSSYTLKRGYDNVVRDCSSCHSKFEIRMHCDGTVTLSQRENNNPYVPALVLLESVQEGENPIYAVVKSRHFLKAGEDPTDSLSYYYDEATCPINWFRDVIALIKNGDPDPHGFFRFKRVIKLDEAEAWLAKHPQAETTHQTATSSDIIEVTENLHLLFPEAFEDGDLIDMAPDPQPNLIEHKEGQ